MLYELYVNAKTPFAISIIAHVYARVEKCQHQKATGEKGDEPTDEFASRGFTRCFDDDTMNKNICNNGQFQEERI